MKTPTFRMLYFIRETFPTWRVDVNVLFGRELLGRGHKIDFVMQANSPDERPGPRAWRGGTVYLGRSAGGGSSAARLVTLLFGVIHDLASLRRISRRDYDAVQVRDKFVVAILALILARLRGLQMFYWLSFPIPEDEQSRGQGPGLKCKLLYIRGRLSAWLLYRWILPHCNHAFVQSQRMLEDIVAHGIDRGKMTPVPMGIPAEDALPRGIAEPGESGHHGFVIGYLGTLGAQRRVGVLVDMTAMLRARGMDARLLLVGDGESAADRDAIESRASELRVSEYVEITGFIPREAALARIRQVQVCISPIFPIPILMAGSPTKLVEYMALGIPVVANDHPDQSFVLRGSRAGLCTPWGARHFARAVRWLSRLNDEQRRVLGERGRVWAQRHRAYDQIANEVERKYGTLLAATLPQVDS